MANSSTHWGDVYARSAPTEVSWFQPEPGCSLELITATGVGVDEAVIDVGGGASVLVDRLLDRGHRGVTVLDVAAGALDVSRERLGDRAAQVEWVVADLLTWQPARRYRVWHDRAVFHFLTDPADRDRYRQVLRAALAPGGRIVVGTFAQDGPTHCSGLPIARYGQQDLAAQFADYRLVRTAREEHRTPSGGVQPFNWVLLTGAGPH